MNYTHLTFEQRYHIELGWRKGLPHAVIARRIGVDRSTVYRELCRGNTRNFNTGLQEAMSDWPVIRLVPAQHDIGRPVRAGIQPDDRNLRRCWPF